MKRPMYGLSDQIRTLAEEKFVRPALQSGRSRFSIAVRDLMSEAKASGIATKDRVPPYCSSIKKQAFLKKHGLRISSIDGPNSGRSTTVVVHYERDAEENGETRACRAVQETAEAKAFRLTEKIRGLLREEITARGGTEAFMRWVRSSEDVK